MSLITEIQNLTSRTLTSLDERHDYFSFSKRIWRLVQQDILEGRTFSFHNPETGTCVNQTQISDRAQNYITEHLVAATFQECLSRFEDYFFDLLKLWLLNYPKSLKTKPVAFGLILQATDLQMVINSVVEHELNELKYKRLAEWFAYLGKLLKLQVLSEGEIAKLTEIKATRDILVHNNRIANEIYVAKSGSLARAKAGDVLEISENYMHESWALIRRVVEAISQAVLKKL